MTHQSLSADIYDSPVSDSDETFELLSRVVSLLYHVLKQSRSEGLERLDFGGAAYDYKIKGATGVLERVTNKVFNRNLCSRFVSRARTQILPLLPTTCDPFKRSGAQNEGLNK